MGELFNFGVKFFTKFSVSNSTIWGLGIMVFLKLVDIFIDWNKADKKMKDDYVSFIEKMAQKGLVSVKIRDSAISQYNELNKEK